jgi:hypothetical protein
MDNRKKTDYRLEFYAVVYLFVFIVAVVTSL